MSLPSDGQLDSEATKSYERVRLRSMIERAKVVKAFQAMLREKKRLFKEDEKEEQEWERPVSSG